MRKTDFIINGGNFYYVKVEGQRGICYKDGFDRLFVELGNFAEINSFNLEELNEEFKIGLPISKKYFETALNNIEHLQNKNFTVKIIPRNRFSMADDLSLRYFHPDDETSRKGITYRANLGNKNSFFHSSHAKTIFIELSDFAERFRLNLEELEDDFVYLKMLPTKIKEIVFNAIFFPKMEFKKHIIRVINESDSAVTTKKEDISTTPVVEKLVVKEEKIVPEQKELKKFTGVKDGKFYVEDKEFNSLTAIANVLSIPSRTLQRRVNDYGWSLEDAINKALESENRVTFMGVTYCSEYAFYKAFGLTKEVYDERKKKGWSIEKIARTPLSGKVKRHPCQYAGKIFPSYYALAKEYSLNYRKFVDAIQNGESIENCVNNPNFKLTKNKSFASGSQGYMKKKKSFYDSCFLPAPLPEEDFLELMYSTEIVRF